MKPLVCHSQRRAPMPPSVQPCCLVLVLGAWLEQPGKQWRGWLGSGCGGMCTQCTRVTRGSAGKWVACLAVPGELRSVSCSGQAAAGEFGVRASGPSSCLSSSCWGADVGGPGDPLWSQDWRELSRRFVYTDQGPGLQGGLAASSLEEGSVVSGAGGGEIWVRQRLGASRGAVNVALGFSALLRKWDVASRLGWGCPAQGRPWGVAA